MYAIIVDGSVSELTGMPPAPGNMYVECGVDAAPGWRLEGGALVPPAPTPSPDPNAVLDAQIAALEAAQHRATRELLLGTDTAALGEAKARLAETDALIAALRARRV